MKTLPIKLDDELDAILETVCAEQGRSKVDLLGEVVRKYVETERLKRSLADPELAVLYERLAEEDIALAEEGMAEYEALLQAADEA